MRGNTKQTPNNGPTKEFTTWAIHHIISPDLVPDYSTCVTKQFTRFLYTLPHHLPSTPKVLSALASGVCQPCHGTSLTATRVDMLPLAFGRVVVQDASSPPPLKKRGKKQQETFRCVLCSHCRRNALMTILGRHCRSHLSLVGHPKAGFQFC